LFLKLASCFFETNKIPSMAKNKRYGNLQPLQRGGIRRHRDLAFRKIYPTLTLLQKKDSAKRWLPTEE
jgi:hypothetical protein